MSKETQSMRPTRVAHHHIPYSIQDMKQFPQIDELDQFLTQNDLHISGLFVTDSEDIHPGEIANALKEMLIESTKKPYYTYPHYKGREM